MSDFIRPVDVIADQWGDPVISPLMVGLPLRDLDKARRYAAALLSAAAAADRAGHDGEGR